MQPVTLAINFFSIDDELDGNVDLHTPFCIMVILPRTDHIPSMLLKGVA